MSYFSVSTTKGNKSFDTLPEAQEFFDKIPQDQSCSLYEVKSMYDNNLIELRARSWNNIYNLKIVDGKRIYTYPELA